MEPAPPAAAALPLAQGGREERGGEAGRGRRGGRAAQSQLLSHSIVPGTEAGGGRGRRGRGERPGPARAGLGQPLPTAFRAGAGTATRQLQIPAPRSGLALPRRRRELASQQERARRVGQVPRKKSELGKKKVVFLFPCPGKSRLGGPPHVQGSLPVPRTN